MSCAASSMAQLNDLERQLIVEGLGTQARLAEDDDGGVDGDGSAGFLDAAARQPIVLPLEDFLEFARELGFGHLAELIALEVTL